MRGRRDDEARKEDGREFEESEEERKEDGREDDESEERQEVGRKRGR